VRGTPSGRKCVPDLYARNHVQVLIVQVKDREAEVKGWLADKKEKVLDGAYKAHDKDVDVVLFHEFASAWVVLRVWVR
jgi:hypothetical protein